MMGFRMNNSLRAGCRPPGRRNYDLSRLPVAARRAADVERPVRRRRLSRFSLQTDLPVQSMAPRPSDREKNRFSARAARYARVGANVGGVAARIAGARLFGFDLDRARNAAELAAALGGLKGPIMKVAQLLATIPEALPPEYINELTKLQSQAPPMGWAFVKRRMQAELGPDWQKKFASFEHHPAAAASLGQVHRATRARRRGSRLQAAIRRHAVRGRGRSPAARRAVRDPPPLRSGDRHQRDHQGNRRAHARGARLPARGQARRALSRHARRARTRSGCRRCGRSCPPAAC